MSVFQGVDHVGVGVGDIDAAIEFYGREVGFDRVLFDWTGELGGLEAYAGRAPHVRIAMLENSGATPIGAGRVKLVQVLDDEGPPPVPEGQAWGEVGVCEICLHVRGVGEVHASLVAAGCEELMPPISAAVVPNDVDLDISYVADPWGTKLELIEWTGLWRSLPGPARAEGVNHVAFGVTDMAADARLLRAARVHRAPVRVVRVLRPDGAVVHDALVRPGEPARAAHDDADADAGRGDRAGRPRPARSRLPGRVGASRPDGLRDPRHEHRPRRLGAARRRGRGARRAAARRSRRRARVALRLLRRARRELRLARSRRGTSAPRLSGTGSSAATPSS